MITKNVENKRIELRFWAFLEKILVRFGHKLFGWTMVDKGTHTEYTPSDTGKPNSKLITTYYYARPTNIPRGPLFSLCETLNNVLRWVRKLSFWVVLLAMPLMIFTSAMETIFEYILSIWGYGLAAYMGCTILNIVLPIVGAGTDGFAASLKKLSEEQNRAAKKDTQIDKTYTARQEPQEKKEAERQSRKMLAEKIQRELEK